jgi:hypothetical protein
MVTMDAAAEKGVTWRLPMPVFTAKLANLVGSGEVTSKRAGGWMRDKFRLTLEGHSVTIKQRKSVLKERRSGVRGRFIESSTVRISKIQSFEEGVEFVQDVCSLLSFATQSEIVPYEFNFEKRKLARSVLGRCNGWRPPFGSGIGVVSDFVTQAWLHYRRYKDMRAIRQLIHMLVVSDMSGTLLETQISLSLVSLESAKAYFALSEGARFKITEAPNGSFRKANGKNATFEYLMKLMLQDVGMPLPSRFQRIKDLRNALIHRGFIRETDNIARHIFGPLPPGRMHTAMFGVMENTQDILREYVLRLLAYKGDYWTYSHEGSVHKKIK